MPVIVIFLSILKDLIIEDLKQHNNNDEIFSSIAPEQIDVHTIFANYRRGRGLRLTRGGLLLMQKLLDFENCCLNV